MLKGQQLNKMAKPSGKKSETNVFRIELRANPDNQLALNSKIQQVKSILQRKCGRTVLKYEVLDTVLDKFLEREQSCKKEGFINHYVELDKQNCKHEKLIYTTNACLAKCMEIASHHKAYCTETLEMNNQKLQAFVTTCHFTCKNGHLYRWLSSPHLLGTGNFLINEKVLFSFHLSGMLESQFDRFSQALGTGRFPRRTNDGFMRVFRDSVVSQYTSSIHNAQFMEVGLTSTGDCEAPIDISTDARHNCRKNSKDTSVVALGNLSHKVLACENISKLDHPAAQKHEVIGCQRVMDALASQNLFIGVWAHDFNTSVNKFVEGLPDPTQNQNEIWHCVKNLKKEIKNVAQGPKYSEGKAWHRQLSDKVQSIATHAHYAIRNCNQDPQELRDRLDAIVPHYSGVHDKCSSLSRCRTDANYEPSRLVVTDVHAQELLTKAIKRTLLYKKPQNFCLARDTCYVESFNNTVLMFTDKRISHSTVEYDTRIKLAVLHWNENVDRRCRSLQRIRNTKKVKKNLSECTFAYSELLWDTYLGNVAKTFE